MDQHCVIRPLSALKAHKDSPPTGVCAACGTETYWARASFENAEDYMCGSCAERRIGGSIPVHKIDTGIHYRINKRNRFGVLWIHYSADPDKNPETERGLEWFNEQRSFFANNPHEWDQLMEIAFHSKSGPRIYPEFDPVHCLDIDLKFDPSVPLMASFDWGMRHAACVFSQWGPVFPDRPGHSDTPDGREYRVLVELLGDNCNLPHFFEWVNRLLKLCFFRDWGLEQAQASASRVSALQREGKLYACADPAGNSRIAQTGISDIRFAEQYGWHIRYKYGPRPERKIHKVRALTRLRDDGRSRLRLRNEAYLVRGALPPQRMAYMAPGSLLSGFMGAYQWQCDARGQLKFPVKAVKDIHSHLMDCVAEGVENTYEFRHAASMDPPEPMRGRPDFCDLTALQADLSDPAPAMAAYYYDPYNDTLEQAHG